MRLYPFENNFTGVYDVIIAESPAEALPEPSQTSKMKLFVKTLTASLIIFAKKLHFGKKAQYKMFGQVF